MLLGQSRERPLKLGVRNTRTRSFSTSEVLQECGEISEQITSYLPACLPHAASAGASDGNDEGRDASLPGPFSGQDERRSGRAGEGGELSMAITQQHESWRQLGQQAAALADLCVHTLLHLTVRDSVYAAHQAWVHLP